MRTILVAEDEPPVLRRLERLLREAGYEVLSVEDGDRACEVLEKTPVDAILTDLNLPMRGGFCFAAAAGPLSADAPVIVLTGEHDLVEITRKLAGALPRAVLPKPFIAEHVLWVLSKVIVSSAGAHDDARRLACSTCTGSRDRAGTP